MKRFKIKLVLLFLLSLSIYEQAYCGKIDTIKIFSFAMKKHVPCIVILPNNYSVKANHHYPVLYLLHGYSGNYLRWITKDSALEEYVDEYQMIIVCPDGYDSWYFDSPINTSVRYETFITKALVRYVDTHYRTVPNRKYRAICGESMGGHGALFLSIRHSNEFGAAASMSGCVDIRPFAGGFGLKSLLGSMKKYPQNWEKYTVMNLIDSLKNNELKIFIDCGVNDPFIKINRFLHKKLLRLHIDHVYIERPGSHNWDYWRKAIPYELLFFKNYFNSEFEHKSKIKNEK